MNLDGIREEIIEDGNIDTPFIWKTLDVQSEEFSGGKLIGVNEDSGCDQKNEDVLEKVTSAEYFMIKLLDILHSVGSAKNKMLKADSKLKEIRPCSKHRKYGHSHCKLHNKTSTVHITLDNFLQRNKHFNSQCFKYFKL